MSIRRSARLGAIPAIKPTIQTAAPKVSRVQQSSVAKPRKTSTTKKTASRSTQKAQAKREHSYWSPEPPTADKPQATPDDQQATNNHTTARPLTPPPLDRPVDPHRTNAYLLTPHGSSVSAYPSHLVDSSPSKTGLPRPAATTGTLLEQAIAHLIAQDPRLQPVIDQHPCPLFSPAGLAEKVDPFNSLASSIIGQQVSGAAAKSIRNKFVALFDGGGETDEASETGRSRFPTPQQVAACDLATLRTAGLSQRKAEYIQGLAEKFASGELSAQMLARASDEELVEKLIAVRGLGKWSVEMFACFALKRMDVFSTGDLGVQRGCAAFVGRDVNKLKGKGGGKFKYMSEKDMLELAAKFAPYRSLFMWYMWRIENVDVAVLTG
ncbi:DNA glycosylase [Penicillium chermesinum]|uniref:DNA glycosylase n=1 Tax=Penicillium chermesinum TaxID=63820 RepID=A0A9W9P8K1_9EURO|nr:DNA glycosylase [Penicillium chermesinum]KAJ5238558.1 DNA glycosylase [Penicillium chermesinum]KAJ6164210.1 DNA glycosylase [Penicillium chermesinum]